MHDWSDNELDGMSREAADKYGPGRGMPDWDTLQKQLDKELPERKEDNRRRFFFLIFLCIILTGVTGYLLISQNSGTRNHENKTLSNASQDHQKEKNDPANIARDNSKSTKNNADGSVATDSQKNNASDKDGKAQPLTAPGKLSAASAIAYGQTRSALSLASTPQNYSSNSAINGKNLDKKKKEIKNKDDEAVAITVENSGVNRNTVSETETEAPKSESATAAATGLTDAGNAIDNDAAKPETEKFTDQKAIVKDTAATDATVKKANTVKLPPKGSAIEVSILAGVDISNVKFKYGDNAGFNAGLLLGYRFNRKWSVGTGLIYTKKNYTAAGTDFNPPKGYWTNGIKLDKVDGSCYMWELPVYASYRFNSNQKSGWFINMGLSTYFMTKEDYTYHYKYNNGNAATRYWQNTDPSNYWFSILSISGGWEKNIGRGLSLGVAPYAKIPLKGVGFGNMHLSSYGLNLLLTYRKATGHK